jgi:hypothetical protein
VGIASDEFSDALLSAKHKITAPTPSKLALCQTSPQTNTDAAIAAISHRESA